MTLVSFKAQNHEQWKPLTRKTRQFTLASDGDGESMFVLVDDAASTIKAVEERWREEAKREWGIEYEPFDGGEGPDIVRGWYKTDPLSDEQLILCTADDPDRTEEWWRFELPLERVADV